jgi:hypothetical protein
LYEEDGLEGLTRFGAGGSACQLSGDTVVAAMDEMAASAKAAEKRAIEAEQRLLELEKVGGGRQH